MAWKIKVLSYLKSLKHWLRRGMIVLKFCFFAQLRSRALFWTFDQAKNYTLTTVLIFRQFQKQIKSLNLLNMIFENSLPKGIFGQNIRDSPNGSLTADSEILTGSHSPYMYVEFWFSFFWLREETLWALFEEKLFNAIFNQLSTGKGNKLNKFTSKMDR